jgi:hypothetical protein
MGTAGVLLLLLAKGLWPDWEAAGGVCGVDGQGVVDMRRRTRHGLQGVCVHGERETWGRHGT